MGLLHCPKCGRDMSATELHCPACGTKMSFFNELKFQIERSPLQVLLVVLAGLFALGAAWFWRMDGGSPWPLYTVIALLTPLVPWVLKRAYAFAAPLDGKNDEKTEQK